MLFTVRCLFGQALNKGPKNRRGSGTAECDQHMCDRVSADTWRSCRQQEIPHRPSQEMYEMEAIPQDSDVVLGDLRGRGEGVTGAGGLWAKSE